jgi:hypothetical protein
MFKEIHLAGSVKTPFGSFCGALADVSAVELGKVAAERCGVRTEDVKETPRGNPQRRPRPNAAPQIGIGAGPRRRPNGNRNGP